MTQRKREFSNQIGRKGWMVTVTTLLGICMLGCGSGGGNPSSTNSGSGTETFKSTDAATTQTFYLVISSDSPSALSLLNDATVGGDSVTKTSGDIHAGKQLCSASLAHEGHTYSAAYYVSGTVPSNVIGNAAAQAQLPALCATLQTESTQNNSVIWTR